MHASYLAMYFCFAIAILLYSRFEGSDYVLFKNSTYYYSSLIILVFSIFLLAGRTHISFLILGAIAYALFRINRKHNLGKSIIAATAVGVFFVIIAMLFPANRERFKDQNTAKPGASRQTESAEQCG